MYWEALNQDTHVSLSTDAAKQVRVQQRCQALLPCAAEQVARCCCGGAAARQRARGQLAEQDEGHDKQKQEQDESAAAQTREHDAMPDGALDKAAGLGASEHSLRPLPSPPAWRWVGWESVRSLGFLASWFQW